MGDGNTHQEGPCKDSFVRGITCLIKDQNKGQTRFTGETGKAFMHSHGIATIAL